MVKYIGTDFTPPDVIGKVTGKAKYAEDIHVDGMVFARLLTSPIPHARIKSIDLSSALAMDGVVGVLTSDEVPKALVPRASILTAEPAFVGDPILAIAAVDDTVATDALLKVHIDYEPLPFCVDPLDSLDSLGCNARLEGNVYAPAGFGDRTTIPEEVRWTDEQLADFLAGHPPDVETPVQWTVGDIKRGFESASFVVEQNFVTAGYAHHSMEPRSSMAYWQNGKCFLYAPNQSQTAPMPGIARALGIDVKDLVFINEHCGGGFGSRSNPYPMLLLPAFFSRKINRPVALHLGRAEEFFLGKARSGFQGHVKIGFHADGRISALDLFIVQDIGSQTGFPSAAAAAGATSLVYQPEAMRFRSIPVMTNTTPKGAQRGPGQNQIAAAIEPLIDKAAVHLEIDRLDIRKINAPDNDSLHGPRQEQMTSAYLKEALDKGAKAFGWNEKNTRRKLQGGSKVTGVGVGQAYHSAGRDGYDGLLRITPDGKIHLHSGVGNLGTYSYVSTTRPVAEILHCEWDNCIIHYGKSTEHLPWSSAQNGSNTSFTHTRANYVAALDALDKILSIAALKFGGAKEDYEILDERVFSKYNPDNSMSYAEVAQTAIEFGGRFDGSEAPADIHEVTKLAVDGIKGTGLVGVAKDTLGRRGAVPGLAVGFAEIELDMETGKYVILDYMGVVDGGVVLHPQGLAAQIGGGAVWGFGMAGLERHVYDPATGIPANVGFSQCKPASYLDLPDSLRWDAVDLPDPDNPVGVKGIGEPVMGCAAAAVLCAISDALGGHVFNRVPVTPDMILNYLAEQKQSTPVMRTNTF
ncbi:MAG: aldehyde oxidase [Woeseia sp.]|nr:aldehyde oxidase [Woeseia sp.]